MLSVKEEEYLQEMQCSNLEAEAINRNIIM